MNYHPTGHCRFCSLYRRLDEFVAGPVVGMCMQCYERHRAAMLVIAGQPLDGCQECGASMERLRAASGSDDIKMYLHSKDGIYQFLCPACSDRYERKRLDLYGRTPYGHAKKLAGAK